MQNNATPPAVSSEALERRHEPRDPRPGIFAIIAGSVVVMVLVCLVTSGLLMRSLAHDRPMQFMKPLGLVVAPDLKPLDRFPAPHLTIDDDHQQMTSIRDRQMEKLNSYGWVDRSNGIVRIPIDRAVELILQRGLPVQTNGPAGTDGSPLQFIQDKAKRQ
jgi:hypothetical protein